MEPKEVAKSEGKKSLEATIVGAVAGLIVGGIVGFSTAATNSDFGSSEAVIAGISTAAGSLTAMNNKSKFVDYLLGIGFANVFYRVGYYGSRALYETLR